MSLTDAAIEAYADPDIEDDILDTLELDHATFATPIRIVTNADADMTLPLGGGGGNALFQALGVSLTLMGFDDDGQTTGQLRIENISSKLPPYLYEAINAGTPLTVKYRGYVASDLSAPGEVRGGMLLTKVSLTPTAAVGTLEPSSKHDTQAFPRLTYSMDKYKALHGA